MLILAGLTPSPARLEKSSTYSFPSSPLRERSLVVCKANFKRHRRVHDRPSTATSLRLHTLWGTYSLFRSPPKE